MSVFDEYNATSNSVFDQFQNGVSENSFPNGFGNSPLGDWLREGFYDGVIDFKKLFEFLIDGVNNDDVTKTFDYENYISTSKVKVTSSEQQAMYSTKDFLFFRDTEYSVHVPYETETLEGEKISLIPKTKLNKKLGEVATIPNFRTVLDFKDEEAYFELGFRYNSDVYKYRIPAEDYAILIRCKYYSQFENILRVLNIDVGTEDNIKDEIKLRFKDAFEKAGSDPNELDWLYEKAPDFVMVERGVKTLLKDLSLILESLVDEIGVNEEKVVLRILKALAVLYIKANSGKDFLEKGANQLLEALITKKVKTTFGTETMFERLYSKMNDKGFGEENFKNLMKFIYGIWSLSSWSMQSSYANGDKTGPENIAYTNKKILGFYQNGFDFNFVDEKEGLRIKVTRQEKQGGSFKDGNGALVTKEIGVYHPYQPIRMPEIPTEGEFVLDNTVIPAFYLKAFDDKAAWSNFEKGAWLALDVITTFTGVGNLLKFRHLLKLKNLASGSSKVLFKLKLAASVIEVTSGALGIMLNFVNDCDPKPDQKGEKSFCQHLREYLFLVDLATLSVDAIVSKLLKKKAKTILDSANDLIEPKMKRHLEEVAGVRESQIDLLENWDNVKVSGRGRRTGQRLSKSNLKKIKTELEKIGVDIELHPLKGSETIDGFFLKNGAPAKMPKKAAAIFITDGVKMKIVLRQGATVYEFFHEFMHLKHAKSLGLKSYLELGGRYTIGELKKETYVYEKIIEFKKYFTRDELEHALGYINSVNNRFGIDDILLSFDDHGKVLKEININEILNKK